MRLTTRFYVGVHALIELGDRFLVLRRSATDRYMPRCWDLPGGEVHAGEAWEDALLREVAEETGLSVRLGKVVYVHNNLSELPGRQTIQFVVRCTRQDDGDVPVRLRREEHWESRWVQHIGEVQGELMPYLAALPPAAGPTRRHTDQDQNSVPPSSSAGCGKVCGLRAVAEADIPWVIGLYKTAIVPVWEAHGRDYQLDRVGANMQSRLDDPHYSMELVEPLGGAEDEALRAYVAWEKHADHTSGHVIAHLRMLLVHPEHRRQALATRLVSHFEEQARRSGCSKILFDVVVGSPANEFYRALGFRHWSNFMEKLISPRG